MAPTVRNRACGPADTSSVRSTRPSLPGISSTTVCQLEASVLPRMRYVFLAEPEVIASASALGQRNLCFIVCFALAAGSGGLSLLLTPAGPQIPGKRLSRLLGRGRVASSDSAVKLSHPPDLANCCKHYGENGLRRLGVKNRSSTRPSRMLSEAERGWSPPPSRSDDPRPTRSSSGFTRDGSPQAPR